MPIAAVPSRSSSPGWWSVSAPAISWSPGSNGWASGWACPRRCSASWRPWRPTPQRSPRPSPRWPLTSRRWALASSSARTCSTWPRCWASARWSLAASPCTARWSCSAGWWACGWQPCAWSRSSAWSPPAAGLALVLAGLVPYIVVLGAGRARLGRLPVARRWEGWLAVAISEEEQELNEAIRPIKARGADVAVAVTALVAVVTASVAMERAASSLGSHYGVPEIVTGGVVLAAVTSLPNAVAAVYLAARGRGAAMLSTTLNSNALNVLAGLLLPATITGLGPPSPQTTLIAVWYLGLTLAALAFAYRDSGVRRASWCPDHRRLSRLSRIAAHHGPYGGTAADADGRSGADRGRRVRRRAAAPPRPHDSLVPGRSRRSALVGPVPWSAAPWSAGRFPGGIGRQHGDLGQQHLVGVQVDVAGGVGGRPERDRVPQRVRP